jgi:mannose-1-phosphate guanylyltransferase / mannose-6-phosphate isomerase
VVITNYDYRLRVAEQLWEIGAKAAILPEPDRRDSAAAVVGAAVAWTTAHDPKTVVAILAADHMFEDGKQFVTFGVTPDHPATGYGYMRERAKARALNYLPLLYKLRTAERRFMG